MEMLFRPIAVTNQDSGERVGLYIPDTPGGAWGGNLGRDNVTVVLGGQERLVPSRLIRVVLEFGLDSQQRQIRTNRGNDCGVFALSCQSGQDYRDYTFGQDASQARVGFMVDEITGTGAPFTDPDMIPGQTAFTIDALPEDGRFGANDGFGAHFMTRANIEDGLDPLYFSKLGVSGPVAAHSLQDALKLYPAQSVGTATMVFTPGMVGASQ